MKESLYGNSPENVEGFSVSLVMDSLEKIKELFISEVNKEKGLESLNNRNGDDSAKIKYENKPIIMHLFEHLIEELRTKDEEIESLKVQIESLKVQLNKYRRKSETDHLTGVKSRSVLEEFFCSLYSIYGNLSLILIDIDDFKTLNDTYGHLEGDRILIETATIFNEIYSEYGGVVIRYGGEEFLVFVPVRQEEALKITKRVQKVVYDRCKVDGGVKVTATYAVVPVKKENDSRPIERTECIRELLSKIEVADRLLYYGKRTGKDKIVNYSVDFYEQLRKLRRNGV